LHDLQRHHFVVECSIAAAAAAQELSLPSWIPGSYLLREFARNVVAIEAAAAGRPVAIEKVGKARWRAGNAAGPLTVTLTVYALDPSVRGAHLDARRGYFNGACLLPAAVGFEGAAVELEIEPPRAPACVSWRVATTLAPVAVDPRGFGTYRAPDYDALIDHPVEISDYERVAFAACGVPHELVVAGRFESDLERVATDLRQLCETQIRFFGESPPFERYCFLGLAVGEGHGGLEHRDSSSLIFSRNDLPKPGELGVPRGYQRFLGLASHEYFHAWHVKRTRPAAFMPYRLDRRNHTRLLWVFEGITSYYQDLFLLRSDLVGVDAYLQRLGELITRVYRTPGRRRQSIAESSFDAWDRLYKPDANSPNAGVSYYTKGALTALALDLTLRALERPVTLDAVVQALWSRHGARDIGVEEDGFEALVEEVAGVALGDFFDRAVRGTEDLALESLLAALGVRLAWRRAAGPGDVGGTPPASEKPVSPSLGASYRGRDGGLELATVLDDGPAQRAGLNPGDVVVAIDGLKVDERTLASRLDRIEIGERSELHAFRGDELLRVEIQWSEPPPDTGYLELDAEADADARARREAWLGV
jgi:predicted metalloprotease with PDZ domain